VVLAINIIIFISYGYLFGNWHAALQSLMTYLVAYKTMDLVIVGLDEWKSLMVISAKADSIRKAIIQQLGLGVTIMYGKGGFSGKDQQILYIIVDRLNLAKLKELILSIDSNSFIAIENIYEALHVFTHKKPKKKLV